MIVLVSILPLVTVVVGAFTPRRGPVMRWGEWTTANLERVLFSQPDPIINTLIFAAIATMLSLVISTLVGFLLVKKRNALTPAIDYLSALPLALSGTVLGIGLVSSFSSGWLPLAGTAAIVVLAYLVRRLPFGIRNASSTLHNIPNSLEDASISLGVPPLQTFLKVVFPLMIPSIAAAGVLVWTTTVAELSASVVVYSAGQETLPIQVFRLIDSNLMAQASAYGLVLIAIILVPILIATTVFKSIFLPRDDALRDHLDRTGSYAMKFRPDRRQLLAGLGAGLAVGPGLCAGRWRQCRDLHLQQPAIGAVHHGYRPAKGPEHQVQLRHRRFGRAAQAHGKRSGDVQADISGAPAPTRSAPSGRFLNPTSLPKLRDSRQSGRATNLWTASNIHVVTLMENTNHLAGAAVPKVWSDVLDPRWKGKLIIADPENSSTAYTILWVYGRCWVRMRSRNWRPMSRFRAPPPPCCAPWRKANTPSG